MGIPSLQSSTSTGLGKHRYRALSKRGKVITRSALARAEKTEKGVLGSFPGATTSAGRPLTTAEKIRQFAEIQGIVRHPPEETDRQAIRKYFATRLEHGGVTVAMVEARAEQPKLFARLARAVNRAVDAERAGHHKTAQRYYFTAQDAAMALEDALDEEMPDIDEWLRY